MATNANTSPKNGYEVIYNGIKELINVQHPGEYVDENGVPLPLEKEVIWKNPGEKTFNVNKNLDILLEYAKEKGLNREVDSQVAEIQLKLERAMTEKEEYFKLYNDLAEEFRTCKRQLLKRDAEIIALKDRLSRTAERHNVKISATNVLKEEIKKYEDSMLNLEHENDKVYELNKLAIEKINSLEDQLVEHEDTAAVIASLESENENLKGELSQVFDRLEKLNVKLNEAKDAMEAQKELLSNEQSLIDESMTISFDKENMSQACMDIDDNLDGEPEVKFVPTLSPEQLKRVRFLHDSDTPDQQMSLLNQTQRITLTTSESEENDSKELIQNYELFIETVRENIAHGKYKRSRRVLMDNVLKKSFYDLLKLPKKIGIEKDWSMILAESYSKLTDQDFEAMADEIIEAYYILSSAVDKKEYDVLLSCAALFKDTFYTSCFKLKPYKTFFGRQVPGHFQVCVLERFVAMNVHKRRVYVLQKKNKRYPTHILSTEDSFRFKDIVEIVEARHGSLNMNKVVLSGPDFDRDSVTKILEISYMLKGEKRRLLMLFDTRQRQKNVRSFLLKMKEFS